MKTLRQIYLSHIAKILGEFIGSWYAHPPALWTKPMGNMPAVTIFLVQDHRRLWCQKIIGLEIIGTWTEADKSYEGSISIEDARLSNFTIDSPFGHIEGLTLPKIYKLRKNLSDFINRRKIEYTTEMIRRYSYLDSIKKKPTPQIELITLIFEKYCDTGPVPFSARDSLISLHRDDWSYSHNSMYLENKQKFVLESLVDEKILIKDQDNYIATSKIVHRLEELRNDQDQAEEKRDAQARTFMLQEKSAKTAKYALYAAIFSGIAGATNIAITIFKSMSTQ